ncbi:polysaccharide lyase 6 family protein [Endozoicomonas sp. G2_1]|uniref:polysaccharide lyase 6 family protein n=1 Tax=Endozoicomonas sp. G2_1 TaxID=2821091 RepID=UPI001ADBAEC5|nr:polysaccharide lyase 6 family protein [Endozoicomonas sp. G2_1]MBO9489308.1 polysaccharide lyase 6 family protein [Endozoicomonas sp. G2_1]
MKTRPLLFSLFFSFIATSSYAGDFFVEDTATLIETLNIANCGDSVVLNNGRYADVKFESSKNCSAGKGIIVVASNPGQVEFTGDVDITLSGRYFELSGIAFKYGTRTNAKGDLITVAGKRNRITNNKFDDFDNQDGAWIKLKGQYNRIDHNEFSGKRSVGSYINIDIAKGKPSYHLVDYNYFTRPLLGSNGGSAARVGHGSMHNYKSRTIFEHNVFDNQNGEAEIVSIKSSENIFRNNTFLNSRGHLSLRQGKRNLVIDNYFLGNGQTKQTGVFIRGEDHVVFNNYFYNMKPTAADKDYATVAFGASTTTPDSNRAAKGLNPYHYPKTQNAFLLNNTFFKSRYSAVYIGSQYDVNDSKNRTTLPENLTIANNHIFRAEKALDQAQSQSSHRFAENYVAKISDNDSLLGFEPAVMRVQLSQGVRIPTTAARNNYQDLSQYITEMKLFKSSWGEYKQFKTRLSQVQHSGFILPTDSDGQVLRPLTKSDVGVTW